MLRPVKSLLAALAGCGALLGAACTSAPAYSAPPMHGMQDGQMQPGSGHGPGPQAGMLDQMRAHHRCIEGEMAKRPDGGRAMPDKAAMTAMMQHCPMPGAMSAAMHESMMMMTDRAPSPGPAHTTPADEQ